MARKDPLSLRTSSAKVNLRLISLKDCPAGFDADVTRATNTQNRIQHRDFAALDDVQHRLAHEMSLDGRRYAFKSGDPDPKGDDGCNIEEATVALACALPDVAMAVQAKREVGALWRDVGKPPYTTLFNDKLTARDMWKAVLIMRAVSDELDRLAHTPIPRADLLAVHGNRFILHRVFRDPAVKGFRASGANEEALLLAARKVSAEAFTDTANYLQRQYPNAYRANLFKNTQKCRDLIDKGPQDPRAEEFQGDLFQAIRSQGQARSNKGAPP
jgi:hypothetical protein